MSPSSPAPNDHAAPPLAITNIAQLVTCAGDDPRSADVAFDRTVVCKDGRIEQVLAQNDFRPEPEMTVLDAGGGLVTPGLIDPHTHPVFAGQRAVEFGLKAEGKGYLEIHKAGGGILSTVRATRDADLESLRDGCIGQLDRLLSFGVTTCEGKSGYALSLEGELTLLKALRAADQAHPIDVIPTLLAAHTVPPEFKDRRDAYVQLIIEQIIPQAAEAGLAQYCDAYCEDGAFSRDEVRAIFSAAQQHGLGLRLHAEQFTDQGGSTLAAEMGAATADHLEAITPEGIDALSHSATTAVLLPGAALTCRCPWPPGRAIADAGVPIALGTDLNPGSSMTASLPLMMSLACTRMGMTVDEAWRAVTVNAANSLSRTDLGRVVPGAQADLALFDAPDYRYVPYHFGENHLRAAIKHGRVVLDRSASL